jgi:hypothetical protein
MYCLPFFIDMNAAESRTSQQLAIEVCLWFTSRFRKSFDKSPEGKTRRPASENYGTITF